MKLIAALMLCALAGCVQKENVPSILIIPTGKFKQECCVIGGFLTYSTTYTMGLRERRVLKVTAQSRPWLLAGYAGEVINVSFSDTLQQPGGNSIDFDCNHVADRIIDAWLVREITPYCASLHKKAFEYWTANKGVPDEFVDSQGTHWRKVKE